MNIIWKSNRSTMMEWVLLRGCWSQLKQTEKHITTLEDAGNQSTNPVIVNEEQRPQRHVEIVINKLINLQLTMLPYLCYFAFSWIIKHSQPNRLYLKKLPTAGAGTIL